MKHPKIAITIRGFGTLTAELYPEKAPKTVENFLSLVDSGFYSGTVFHRVIKGFMIQGGGYTEDFAEKRAAAIPGEFRANGFMANDLHHAPGVLSMARTQDPDSASSQFFIMHGDAGYLDSQYAGFGRVTEGQEIVDRIAARPTGRCGWFDDVPKEAVVIERIERIGDAGPQSPHAKEANR